MEASSSSSSSWASGQQKRKRSQVVPHDGMEFNTDDDPAVSLINTPSSLDYKNKQPMDCDTDWQDQIKESYSEYLIGSSDNLEIDETMYASNEQDALHYTFSDEDEDYYCEEDDYGDYEYDTELVDNDCNYNLAAKFDNLDLPTGVEAPLPWLQKSIPENSNKIKPREVIEVEIDKKYKEFKQFDTVIDHSDHHYNNPETVKGVSVKKPTKDWAKRIQHEWKVLEKDLPESIYVRVYEDRMDILRAAIEGPAGTPYHNGLFFFDVFFPNDYPNSPPLVHYHAGGLRLNPNLYQCGKVCLSLLGTWSGSGCEKWNPSKSTMLQVLVSIQALILNEKPYFNEPGYASYANTDLGERNSLAYNQDAFLLSCKTMLYSLRRPPKNFEDFVAGHFRKYGNFILKACKAYMAGAQVGCNVEAFEEVKNENSDSSNPFKAGLRKLYEDLLMEFTVKGADCDKFLAEKVKAGAAARAAANPVRLGDEAPMEQAPMHQVWKSYT